MKFTNKTHVSFHFLFCLCDVDSEAVSFDKFRNIYCFFSQRNEENHSPNQIYIPSLISITNLTRKSFHRYQLMFFLSETQSQEIGKTIMRKQSSDCNVSSGPYRTLSSVYLKPSRPKAHGKIVVAIYFLNY